MVSPESEKILEVLKTTMRVLGYSSRDIERRMGISASYLGRIFSGKVDLKVDHVGEIARALELDPAEVFQIAFPLSNSPASPACARLREAMSGFAGRAPGAAGPPAPQAAPPVRAPALPSAGELESLMAKTLARLFENLPAEE